MYEIARYRETSEGSRFESRLVNSMSTEGWRGNDGKGSCIRNQDLNEEGGGVQFLPGINSLASGFSFQVKSSGNSP